MAPISKLGLRFRTLGARMLLALAVWISAWPACRAGVVVFRLHFEGSLCSTYIGSSMFALNINLCAIRAQAAGAPAFSFCPNEGLNCIISSSSYPRGAWDVTQPLCRLFSSLLPVPYIPPPPLGTKRFVLSASRAIDGSSAALKENGFCTSQGYEFGVIATAAESAAAFAQTGDIGWLNLDATHHWPDGSLLNQCELQFSKTPGPDDCSETSGTPSIIMVASCGHDIHYALCQTFE